MKTRALTPAALTFTAGAASLAQAGVTVRDLTSLPLAGRTLVSPPATSSTSVYTGLSIDFDAATLAGVVTTGTTVPPGADVAFSAHAFDDPQIGTYREVAVIVQNGAAPACALDYIPHWVKPGNGYAALFGTQGTVFGPTQPAPGPVYYAPGEGQYPSFLSSEYSEDPGSPGGFWNGVRSGYMGLRFNVSGFTYYGFVAMRVLENGDIVVDKIGRETSPNTPVDTNAAGTPVPVPANFAPTATIQPGSGSTKQIKLSWPVQTGSTVVVEQSTNMATWQPAPEAVTVESGQQVFRQTVTAGIKKYFRVKVTTP